MAPYQSSSHSSRSNDFSPTPPAHSPTQSLRALELSTNDEPPLLGRHGRSNTITSLGGFDFQHTLLPLSLSGENEDGTVANGQIRHEEERHVSLIHGIALIVGAQVGSGIFSSPGVVVGEVGSVGASLGVWLMSGVLAWTGASSFAELGCAVPLSGGAQAYLAYAFGPMTSYLFTWTAVTMLKPGSAAMIALIFGEYINRLVSHTFSSPSSTEEVLTVPEWSIKLTATIALILVSLLNILSRTSGSDSTLILTTIKIGALVFVAILGFIALVKDGPGESLSASGLFEGTKSDLSSYAIALYSGLWAFDGWDSCCWVTGEMINPSRNLPRAIHSSMSIVLTLFILANISYFIVLSPEIVAASNTVALDFGKATIGQFGMVVFSVLVAVSCFGALNGGFFTTARLIYAASREHFLPSIFSKLHPKRRTPDYAIGLQAGLALFFVIFGGGFRALLNFFSVASWFFYLLTVLGLLILRIKEPHLDRPYKAWLINPIIFCAVAMFLLLMPIFAAPYEALAAFLFIGTGVPMYYLTYRSRIQASQGYNAMDGDRDRSEFKATISDAWSNFTEDLNNILPDRWQSSTKRPNTIGSISTREERRGMLREENLEMSER
ncbi:L-methionine transporter [Kwoniella mangroviensis CBS 10435]|uniref:L-methionine transporter n=1 Tax=Kwoniella mangroviensis CBS 10435 TaxID=1331196 RepID=A0A1B9IJH8_9TREE|nr:L-methionine transporter [Kwoniella mangroviensis CBS 10435]OCF71675.1 L-methionine transporter [Kwoniella mangroviensis CBS 8886]